MSYRKIIAAICLITVSLIGCGNLNSYTFQETSIVYYAQIPAVPTAEVKREQEVSLKNETGCPVFSMPALAPVPPIPLHELTHIPHDDIYALDRIQQKHIDELRLYISNIRRDIIAAQRKYQSECPDALRK